MEAIGIQLDIAWEDKPANWAAVDRLATDTSVSPGALLVLPEMFATGFSMNVGAVAEAPGGPTETFLAGLARRIGAAIAGGVATKSPTGRGRNEAVLFGPDGAELARYGKRHPFSYAGEADHYEPGERIVTFRWAGMTVAPLICYDLRFPEAFRLAVRQGAEAFVVIANWPAARQEHWTTLLRARAIENQAYVIAVNRCGNDPHRAYAGGSMIVDPWGAVLADAGDAQGVLRAAIDLDAVRGYRREFPALADMRHWPERP